MEERKKIIKHYLILIIGIMLLVLNLFSVQAQTKKVYSKKKTTTNHAAQTKKVYQEKKPTNNHAAELAQAISNCKKGCESQFAFNLQFIDNVMQPSGLYNMNILQQGKNQLYQENENCKCQCVPTTTAAYNYIYKGGAIPSYTSSAPGYTSGSTTKSNWVHPEYTRCDNQCTSSWVSCNKACDVPNYTGDYNYYGHRNCRAQCDLEKSTCRSRCN